MALLPFLFLEGKTTGWFKCRTPPWEMVTPPSSFLSSESLWMASCKCRGEIRRFLLRAATSPAISTISWVTYWSTAAIYTGAPAPIRSANCPLRSNLSMRLTENCSPAREERVILALGSFAVEVSPECSDSDSVSDMLQTSSVPATLGLTFLAFFCFLCLVYLSLYSGIGLPSFFLDLLGFSGCFLAWLHLPVSFFAWLAWLSFLLFLALFTWFSLSYFAFFDFFLVWPDYDWPDKVWLG